MIIITGLGRSGTSFLMELFTMLDFNTGFSKKEVQDFLENPPTERAGFERNFNQNLEVIKSPGFMVKPELILDNWKFFEYLIIAIRKEGDSSKSRILVQKQSGSKSPVNGGIVGINDVDIEKQKEYFLRVFYNFFFEISDLSNKRIIFIQYPKLKDNPKYLFKKLFEIFNKKNIDWDDFIKQFKLIRKEGWSLLN